MKNKKKKKKIKKIKKSRNLLSSLKLKDPTVLNIFEADFKIIMMTLLLIVFGVIMVFSASYYWSMDQYDKPYNFLIKSGIWACGGMAVMYVFSVIDYRFYQKHYKVILGISIVLLMLLFTPLGKEVNGATRWLNLGFTIMPGEIAKLCGIIFTAGHLSRRKCNVDSFKDTLIPILAVCAVYFTLIIKQPNMSTAATIIVIIMAMLFVAGVNIIYFAAAGIGGVALGVIFILAGGGYRLKRVTSFLDPFADPLGDAFQVVQSLMAMGSGGIFGRGLGNSVQKNLYLPEPHTDFILAIIGEELGFVGILILILAFVVLIYNGLKVAMKAPDRFGFLLCAGIMMMIGVQVIFNIAIVTSSMPPTGVALPFVSYGGNATLMFCAGIGIVLNVSKRVNRLEREKERKEQEKDRIYFDRG